MILRPSGATPLAAASLTRPIDPRGRRPRLGRPAHAVCLALVFLIAACAGPGPTSAPGSGSSQPAASQPVSPKRITAVIRGTPISLVQQKTNRSVGSPPGLDAVEELVLVGLSYADEKGDLHPRLAE